MPSSMPDSMCASRCSLSSCSHEHLERGSTVDLGEGQGVHGLRVREALVDLGRDDPLVRHDLAELAVEADLEAALGHHDVAPGAADPQVDVAGRHLAPVGVPPAPDQLRLGPGPPHQVRRCVELARDQDLLVAGERHRRAAATRHRHRPPPPAAVEFVQHGVQGVEAVGPQSLVVLDPVVNRLQRRPVEPVEPLPAVLADLDGAHLAQDPQVLGDLRLGESKGPRPARSRSARRPRGRRGSAGVAARRSR